MLAERVAESVFGHASPRIAPPLPLLTDLGKYRELSARIGFRPFPWQDTAAQYLNAVNPDGRWSYPEVAVIVARQNGKTELLVPHILTRLLAGRRIMHTAQNRELPREVFGKVADLIVAYYSDRLARRPRFANGQEEIRVHGGGIYRIVAPTRSGARGFSADDLLLDEILDMDDFDFMSAAEPTLSSAPNPQVFYLSNAGSERSVVLNSLRERGAKADAGLAYLEWSAAPQRSSDDVAGWLEANPAVGHMPGKLDYLARKHESYRMAGAAAVFETEHLCRWVVTMRERLVDEYTWNLCRVDELPAISRPVMGVSMDPAGRRASAVIAWRTPGGHAAPIAITVQDTAGNPIDTDALGRDLRRIADHHNVTDVVGDPISDAQLAKFFRHWTPITGRTFANASSHFVLAVENRRVMWNDAGGLTTDLAWTTRKQDDESGAFAAVRADDDRPITAAMAAIRAVYAASSPVPTGEARIW